MPKLSRPPVARLSTPGDLLAAVPTLCGFWPQESLVVLSLRGARRRLGLTMRLDLPPVGGEADVAELLAARVAGDGGRHAVVAVFSEHGRAPALVSALSGALARLGVGVAEALHVQAGRWSSYLCSRSCCPPEGTPLPEVDGALALAGTLDGRAVLPSRADLVRSLAPPRLLAAAAATQHLDQAAAAWQSRRSNQPAGQARQADLAELAEALQLVEQGRGVPPGTAARVAVALHDVAVRDELLCWSLERSDAVLSLATQGCRLVVPPYDAPICTVVAWVAYARGDGAQANVALDRALGSDPSNSLALLLRHALDAALDPALLRETVSSPGSPSSC
jgi:hypothetical protein